MCCTHDVLIFLAGFEAFHTLLHIFLRFTGLLPVNIFNITFTDHVNLIAIIVNAVITLVLLYSAHKIRNNDCCD